MYSENADKKVKKKTFSLYLYCDFWYCSLLVKCKDNLLAVPLSPNKSALES